MPILAKGRLTIDYMDEGSGRNVVLLHSSVTGNQQWRGAALAFKGYRRVIAPNLFGYGETSAWTGPSVQKISDQAALVCAVLEQVEGPIDLVGHSFGALVALEVAAALGYRVGRIIVFEPNPFALLDRPKYADTFAEVRKLYGQMRAHSLRGDWFAVAEPFVDYFSGDGSWAAMPVERRSALAASLAPTVHEWDAVMDPELRVSRWEQVTAPALLMWASDTRPALLAIAKMLIHKYPSWECEEIKRGGHMGPLSRPRIFNAHVERFLGGH
jgi:pimeloyl-ACP methyl ester carboxylesterase